MLWNMFVNIIVNFVKFHSSGSFTVATANKYELCLLIQYYCSAVNHTDCEGPRPPERMFDFEV